MAINLTLRAEARATTLTHRHTNCCLRYSSSLSGGSHNDMIMIAGNLRAHEDGDFDLGRLGLIAWICSVDTQEDLACNRRTRAKKHQRAHGHADVYTL